MRRVVDSVSRGLFLIVLGIIFFLNTYGVLPWGFWVNVIDLWPLILIFGGIALLFNKRVPFSAVMVVFLLALVGYSFVQGVPNVVERLPLRVGQSSSMDLSVLLENDVKNSDLQLNLGGARINLYGVKGETSQNDLLTGTYRWSNSSYGGLPELTHKRNGDTTRVQFNSEKIIGSGNSQLELKLSDQVDYNVEVDSGAVSGTLDFSQLRVKKLDMSTGASDVELRFGDTGVHTEAKISAGASKVTLVVPENVGLKVQLSGIAGDTNFTGDGFFLSDKEWVSSNYNEAKSTVELDISVAAGKVNLERPGAVQVKL